jgi:hypothetical protein
VAYLQKLQELDAVVAPYREQIKKFDFTEAQAIDQLFKWQMGVRPEDVTPETQGGVTARRSTTV